ncbi:MAG: DUF3846 domain-containing protein [Tissierellales bacterium]|jgi:uncharacterized protein YdeI (YjbR/CyaY-like superfamily)|nr:DUF3846 domain-containing protein [Tissierellales bacterium]
MKVIMKKVGEELEPIEVSNNLSELQKLVGGYIECIELFDSVVLLCDEDGSMKKLPVNFSIRDVALVRNVIFLRLEDGEFTSIKENDLETIKDLLQ